MYADALLSPNQSINQSVNQSVNIDFVKQSINQSFEWSVDQDEVATSDITVFFSSFSWPCLHEWLSMKPEGTQTCKGRICRTE